MRNIKKIGIYTLVVIASTIVTFFVITFVLLFVGSEHEMEVTQKLEALEVENNSITSDSFKDEKETELQQKKSELDKNRKKLEELMKQVEEKKLELGETN